MGRFSSLPFIILGAFILCSGISRSQGIFKISTDEKISRSSLVVEGKVVSKRSYWDEGHRMIYTSNEVEIYKIFKGSWQKNVIEIITVGGAVDGHYIHASHLLSLDKNDIGVFFCTNTKNNKFDVYSSSQGFFKYDLQSKKATAPFVEYDDIERTLYPELNNKIKERIQIRNTSFSVEKASKALNLQSNSVLAPAISSFSPTTVYGGAFMDPTNNLLTITGTGFGTKTGNAAISFQSADANPGTYITLDNTSPLIVSWSDVQIRVRVPGNAGTGLIRVFDAGGTMVTSTSTLTVLFTILTADLGGSYGIKQFNLGNRNGAGGYSIKYSTNTSNSGVNINTSPAKETFQRALDTWRNVGVNFIEGGTSTVQLVEPDDGENIVMFDNGGTGLTPLAAGVLATCYSGLTICTNDPVNNQTVKTGFDIVIRNSGFSSGSTPFTFGPCPPYSSATSVVDLETVLLHELGHAVNLGHVVDNFEGAGVGNVNPPKVMNFSLTINQRRISLDYSSITGAAYQVNPDTYTYGNCVAGTTQMVPLTINAEPKDNCPGTFPTTTTTNFSTVNFNLALATSNKYVDPGYNQMENDASGTNITNTAFYALRTNNTGGNLSIKVENYTTSPTEIAACTIGQGVEVTGVKMSLYKVNNCPDGGDYPAPIAYNVFKQNGTLPLINGLTAASNYLLVVDGLQNTKAIFDLNISGSALLEKVTTLSGNVFDTYNILSWTTDTVFGIASMHLERSEDGTNFTPLFNIVGDDNQEAGEYTDNEPFSGISYYRLATENTNGTIEYSNVLPLTRSNELFFAPVNSPIRTDNISVKIINNTAQNYTFALRNGYGQTIYTRQTNLPSGQQTLTIPAEAFQNGVYYLTAYGSDNKRIRTVKIVIFR